MQPCVDPDDLRPMNPTDQAHAVHDRLIAVLRHRRRAEHAAALLLRRVADERLHHVLGYGSIYDYAEQALDLSLRQARDLLQIGGALPSLPALDAAFADGRLPWTKVREVLRVAAPETEAEWVQAATTHTSRVLEAMVSRSRVGDRPRPLEGDPRGEARRRVVFEMEAADAALLRDALALLRAQAGAGGAELDDGAMLAAMAQRVLFDAEGEGAPIAERHRVVLTQCHVCGDAHAAGSEVSETLAAQATCDADVVDLRPGPRRGHRSHVIPPAARRAVLHRDGLRCGVPGCRCRLWLDVHHLRPQALGGGHEEANLVCLCSVHHRLVHEGLLGLRRLPDGAIEVTTADERRSTGRSPTWVVPRPVSPWRVGPAVLPGSSAAAPPGGPDVAGAGW